MSDSPNVLSFIRDWWGVAAGAATLLIGFRVGAARRTWDIARLGEELGELKARISTIEKTDKDEAVTLAEIKGHLSGFEGQMAGLQKSLDELRSDFRNSK